MSVSFIRPGHQSTRFAYTVRRGAADDGVDVLVGKLVPVAVIAFDLTVGIALVPRALPGFAIGAKPTAGGSNLNAE